MFKMAGPESVFVKRLLGIDTITFFIFCSLKPPEDPLPIQINLLIVTRADEWRAKNLDDLMGLESKLKDELTLHKVPRNFLEHPEEQVNDEGDAILGNRLPLFEVYKNIKSTVSMLNSPALSNIQRPLLKQATVSMPEQSADSPTPPTLPASSAMPALRHLLRPLKDIGRAMSEAQTIMQTLDKAKLLSKDERKRTYNLLRGPEQVNVLNQLQAGRTAAMMSLSLHGDSKSTEHIQKDIDNLKTHAKALTEKLAEFIALD